MKKNLMTPIKSGSGLITSALLLGFLPGACSEQEKDTKTPNILFAISDDQSFFHTGISGCDWVKTPNFDRVAGEGILFSNCYTPNAKCAPSRSSIITGRNSWQLEQAGNHVSIFPKKFSSFCEVLDNSGQYFVGYTGKGVAPVDAQGRNLTGKGYHDIKLTPPGEHISDVDYAANFRNFYSDKPAGKPFFFWYGAIAPYRAYEYGIGKRVGGKSIDMIDKVPGFWPANDTVRTDMLDYAFEIEYFDKHLGEMLAFLEEKGEPYNTVVIVTSDNGMPFPRCKGIQYEYSNHMPLAIMWPSGIRNPGRKVEDFVSFIDFAPTILELSGVGEEAMQPVQGKSLTPIFLSEKGGQVIPERNFVLLGQERHDVGRPGDVGYPVRSIIQDGFLYIHNFEPDRWPMCNPETGYLNTDGSPTKTLILEMRRRGENRTYWDLCFGKKGSEELYNIAEDPECLVNLIDEKDYREKADALRQKLFRLLEDQGDPRMFGNGDVFDEYLYAHESHRNFYERYMKGEIEEYITGWAEPSDYEDGPLE